MGYSFFQSRRGGRPIPLNQPRKGQAVEALHGNNPEMEASVTINGGELLEYSAASKLQKISSQTATPQAVAIETKTSTATGGETIAAIDSMLRDGIWKTSFTPLVDGLPGLAGGSTTVVKVASPAAYSNDDWKGGVVYCVETGEQRTITASDNPGAPGNTLTLTVTQPFSATSVGKTFRATLLGLKKTAVKHVATTFDVPSQVVADQTGGPIQIMDVDLSVKEVLCLFA